MRKILVTLSGTHGTGKSTNAGRVYYSLNDYGYKFSYLRHQDLIDPFGFVLRRAARILRFSDTVQLEKMRPVRVLWSLYFLLIYYPLLAGGITLRRLLGYNVVADRYVYDLIVAFWGNRTHVPLEHLLVWILPRPDISFFLDADITRILADRPEHSGDFIRNEKFLYDTLGRSFQVERIHTSSSKQIVWERIFSDIEHTLQNPNHHNPQKPVATRETEALIPNN